MSTYTEFGNIIDVKRCDKRIHVTIKSGLCSDDALRAMARRAASRCAGKPVVASAFRTGALIDPPDVGEVVGRYIVADYIEE